MSGSGETDPRPRPQYGEYATHEEQQARIRRPDATEALSAGIAPDAPAPAADAGSAPRSGSGDYGRVALPTPASAGRGGASPASPTGELTRGQRTDRLVTVLLLAYGLVNVVLTAPGLFAFEQFANDYFAVAGIDAEFTNVEQGRIWGPIGAALFVAGWIVTALLSWLQLRRRRLAFWIPLVGAVVTGALVAVCIFVPLTSDPGFATLLDRFAPQG
jgi:hypothetical protein